jgi:chaperonin cofactor prefoldin
MRRKVWACSVVVMILLAAAGTSAQKAKGGTPNGSPFVALQTQIDALETRMTVVEESIGTLDARWQEAEARLDTHAGSLQALVEADAALQELMSALRAQIEALETRLATLEDDVSGLSSATSELAALKAQLEALKLEVNEKQAAIVQSCAPGSSIRQVTATGTVACEVDDASTGGGAAAPIVLADYSSENVMVNPGGSKSQPVFCPSGYKAISGGYVKGTAGEVIIDAPDGNGWRVALVNPPTSPAATLLRVFVRCIVP